MSCASPFCHPCTDVLTAHGMTWERKRGLFRRERHRFPWATHPRRALALQTAAVPDCRNEKLRRKEKICRQWLRDASGDCPDRRNPDRRSRGSSRRRGARLIRAHHDFSFRRIECGRRASAKRLKTRPGIIPPLPRRRKAYRSSSNAPRSTIPQKIGARIPIKKRLLPRSHGTATRLRTGSGRRPCWLPPS